MGRLSGCRALLRVPPYWCPLPRSSQPFKMRARAPQHGPWRRKTLLAFEITLQRRIDGDSQGAGEEQTLAAEGYKAELFYYRGSEAKGKAWKAFFWVGLVRSPSVLLSFFFQRETGENSHPSEY